MFDAVFVAGLASSDQDRRACRVGCIDQVYFARLVVVDDDLDEAVGLGAADGDEEAGVGFLVDLDVGVVLGPQRMAPDRLRAVVFIEADVEQRAAIGGPYNAAARIGDDVGKVLAGCKIAEADRRKLRALVVDGVGEDRVVGAVGGGAELPIGLALRLDIAVEENCFALAAARPAAQARVLPANFIARIIVERAIGRGHGAVVLLEAAFHLGKQRFPQGGDIGHRGFGVGILGFEIGADVARKLGGLTHHLLPVVRPEPGIVVADRNAVVGGNRWPLFRTRRSSSERILAVLGHGRVLMFERVWPMFTLFWGERLTDRHVSSKHCTVIATIAGNEMLVYYDFFFGFSHTRSSRWI